MRPNRWCLLASVATSIFFEFPPSATSALNNVPLDLAIIARVGYSDEVVENVKNVLGHLPDIFPFGRDKTRVAVLALAADWTTSTNLTESPSEYRRVVGEIKGSKDGNDLEPPLKTIREKIFLDPKRPRVIMLVNEGWTVSDGAMNEAAALRSSGVWFSVICQEVVEPAMGRLRSIADHFINFEFAVGLSTQFRASHLEEVKRKNDERLCAYNSSCFFTDDTQSECTKDWWTPLAPTAYGSCSDIVVPPPAIRQPCHRNECLEICDSWWPWQKPTPNCDQECGRTNASRVGTADWKQLEFCPRQFECQVCTTTTATTTTTITAAAATTAAVDTITSQSMGTEAITAGPTTVPVRTTDRSSTRKMVDSQKLRPLQIGLIVALSVALISVAVVVGLFFYRWRRRAGSKALMLKYGQGGSEVDSATSTTTLGNSVAVMTSLSSVGSASSMRRSKSVSKGSAPTAKYAGTKSSPTSAKSGPRPSSKASPTRAKQGKTKGAK